jgi:hypothetical protein
MRIYVLMAYDGVIIHLYYKKKCGRGKVCDYPATFTYMS